MDITCRCREQSTIKPATENPALIRARLHVFLVLASAMLCGQALTVQAAPETPSAVKRALPSRVTATDQKALPVPDKQPATDEPEQTAPLSQKTDAPQSGVKKPLPVRNALPDQNAPAATTAEKRLPARGESGSGEVLSGDKRPLPLRSLTPDQKSPVAGAAVEQQAPAAEGSAPIPLGTRTVVVPSGDKRPLPLRTVVTDVNQAPAAGTDDKKQPAAESVKPLPTARMTESPSAGEKRPLPLRGVVQDQAAPAAVPPLAGQSDGTVPEPTVPAAQKAAVTGSADKRPLPARSTAADLPAAGSMSAVTKKLLEAGELLVVPAETAGAAAAHGEKRPLPLRSAAAEQSVSPAAAQAVSNLSPENVADQPAVAGTKAAAPASEAKRPLPARSLADGQKAPLPVRADVTKPLDAAKQQADSGENLLPAPSEVVKRPLPGRTALLEQKPVVSSAPEEQKLPEPLPRQPDALVQKDAVHPVVIKKPLPAPGPLNEQKANALAAPHAGKLPAVDKAAASATEKKALPVAAIKKTDKPARMPLKETPAEPSGNWTVLVGSYLREDLLATDLARVRKAGLRGAVQPGARQKAVMIRLLLAEYGERGAAQSALDKLKRHTADAFMLDHDGIHAVYAGSYLLESRAASEKERLGAAGFALSHKKAEVAIPVKNLSAGSFADKRAAEAVLDKLTAAGLRATLVQK